MNLHLMLFGGLSYYIRVSSLAVKTFCQYLIINCGFQNASQRPVNFDKFDFDSN